MVKCASRVGAHPESALGLGGRRELTPEPAPAPPGGCFSGGAILVAGLRLSFELRLPCAFRPSSSIALRTRRPGFAHGDGNLRRGDSISLCGSELREAGDELWLLPRLEPQPYC